MIKYYKVNMYDLTTECFKIDFSQSPLVIQWENGLRHNANMVYIDNLNKSEITEDEWLLNNIK
tara:strand:- start:143 stop:331 length:189 start_codon:yes stop_codon:yes gene_type:complete